MAPMNQKVSTEVMNQDLLKSDIKSGNIRRLYLFTGPEEYLKRFYTESIEKAILSEDMKTLNRVVLEGKQDIAKLKDYCETLPVFSERKVVIVKESGMFKGKKKPEEEKKENSDKKGKKEKREKSQADGLSLFLEDMPDHTCLIFLESEIDKRLKTIEVFKEKGLIVEFPYSKPEDLAKWVAKRFRAEGKEIDVYTAAQLVETCEQGMTDILNEIMKLTAFLENRGKVTGADIEKVCSKSVKARVFDMTDAIAEKRCSRALELLNDMIILKEPVPKIIFMITRQFRQILQIKLLRDEGNSSDAIASKLKLNPYVAGKIFKQAGRYDTSKLKKALESALEFDLAVKTGRLNDRMAAELMIIEFSK